MQKIFLHIILLFCIFSFDLYAQENKSDAHIIGHVVCCDEHIPFATVAIKGTSIGTTTDQSGHYQLINVPPGELVIFVRAMGYKPSEKIIAVAENQTVEIKFELEEDILNIEEVVVSADRSEQKRTEAPVIVNTISPKLFNSSQSISLGEGLNFTPGLRLENNCQNCGFTQVRINGMEGPYSQILINSRPIFSGLAGVYGLELIPANMIEKVEVVRGGGSALFGSNAIAGTINIILKEPVTNTYEVGGVYSLTGVGNSEYNTPAPDYTVNFNTSLVSNDAKTGVAIFGFTRDRKMFDANGDRFSEISPMKNLTLGSRLYQKIGDRSELSLDFFTINEQRDGGNDQAKVLHERKVAEAVKHDLKTLSITFEKYFRKYDLLSVFSSGQFLTRDSYYGANYSLSDYGQSTDKTYNFGVQYKALLGNSSLITGFENTGGYLLDKKLSYPDIENAVIQHDSIISIPHTENTTISDQLSTSTGFFAQYNLQFTRLKISVGSRIDHYRIKDFAKEGRNPKSGNVISPRLSIMYDLTGSIQGRISYSQGYRAPQIFDEDLHIETSGSRQVINENDPDLKQETSHSYMLSLDYNGTLGSLYSGLLIEGFYTRLEDPFVNEIGLPDESGTVIYKRVNAQDGATVQGLNIEFKLKTLSEFTLTSGFTIQSSLYDVNQEFDEKRFFRTPNHYGYFAADWDLLKSTCISITGNYTGKMLVPYFGTEISEEGELRQSDTFFDLGTKIEHSLQINSVNLVLYAGIKNMFNSYQSDFDFGENRDPSYIYGPIAPRTIYLGIKLKNF